MRAMALALLLPGAAHAACSNDLPGSGVLNVHMFPTEDSVIGGIGANQCGIEVTDFCENGRCLAFFQGLSGYIDVTGLQSGTIDGPVTGFSYELSRIERGNTGEASVLPISEEEPFRIDVTLAAGNVTVLLPPPYPAAVLQSTGSSGWEGVVTGWPGSANPFILYFDRLGATTAILEVLVDGEILVLDAILFLERVDARNPNPIIGRLGTPPCVLLYGYQYSVEELGQPALTTAFEQATRAAEITDWDNLTVDECAAALDVFDSFNIEMLIEAAETAALPME